MTRFLPMVALVVVFSVLLSLPGVSDAYTLQKSVLSSAGPSMTSSGYRAQQTLTQTASGRATSANYAVLAGFWPHGQATSQGGETCATAIPIPSLPFTATGTTCGHANDVNPPCGGAGGAPDVFYSYTAAAGQSICISLCCSGYDTVLGIYDAGLNAIACNDDFCADQSQIQDFVFPAAGTYCIVVDGYGPSCGNYTLDVSTSGCSGCGGACCLNDGTCITTTRTDCEQRIGCGRPGGGYMGGGTSCSPNPCPPPDVLGACCFPDGGCVLLTSAFCTLQSGIYGGNGTVCDAYPCPPPTQNTACGEVYWTELSAVGPQARANAAMAFDIDHGEMVLYGGSSGATILSDTWVFDGTTWTQVGTNGPPGPRYLHAMAYDLANHRVVLFGGDNGGAQPPTTYVWNGATRTWSLASSSGPTGRVQPGMAYDMNRGKVVLFGGYDTQYQSDTWEWSGTTWGLRTTANAPSARQRPSMAYDLNNQNVVLYGGFGNSGLQRDTWIFDGTDWSLEATTGPLPGSAFGMAFDGQCNQILMFGPAGNQTWQWNGISWFQHTATLPGPRSGYTMAYDVLRDRGILFGGNVGATRVCETWEWRCTCDAASIDTDANGNPIIPSWADTVGAVTNVDSLAGYVDDLYGCFNTDTDVWYPQSACDPSLGGWIPPEAENYNCDDSLRILLGDPNVTCEEVAHQDSLWQEQILQAVMNQPDSLNLITTRSSAPYDTTRPPHQPTDPEGCYAFCGRDIVFVHGLNAGDHIIDFLFGLDPRVYRRWRHPTTFPADIQNPEYYPPNGYFYQTARNAWDGHIQRYLTSKGYKNRYLIVSWNAMQPLHAAADAFLAQVGDAMATGRGVYNPVNRADSTGFGSGGFVVVSHCAGTQATEIAMTAAHDRPQLQSSHIPRFCKAHIAIDGNYHGSRYATAIIAMAMALSVPAWGCDLANNIFWVMGDDPLQSPLSCPYTFGLSSLVGSAVMDQVPLVHTFKWHSYYQRSPIKTINILNGHPYFLTPFKYAFLAGFDDGVIAMNCQSANPNQTWFWPSGFRPAGSRGKALRKTFDLGVFLFRSPFRAVSYYIDQVVDKHFNFPGVNFFGPQPIVAGTATPYISPTGMRQYVGVEFRNTVIDPLNRWPNHYSYIQGTDSHFKARTGTGFQDNEETRVITDPHIFDPVPKPHGDNQPLLTPGDLPSVEHWIRGWKIKIFKRRPAKWIWKREYDLLSGWQTKTPGDYVYETILHCGAYQNCPPPSTETPSEPVLPERFDLAPAWPNPARGSTVVYAALPGEGHLRAEVFDVKGRLVRSLTDRVVPAGELELRWDGKDEGGRQVAAGFYYVQGVFRGKDGAEQKRYSKIVMLK